jgi:uncharacterized protein (DUF4213/DUF364 family)
VPLPHTAVAAAVASALLPRTLDMAVAVATAAAAAVVVTEVAATATLVLLAASPGGKPSITTTFTSSW